MVVRVTCGIVSEDCGHRVKKGIAGRRKGTGINVVNRTGAVETISQALMNTGKGTVDMFGRIVENGREDTAPLVRAKRGNSKEHKIPCPIHQLRFATEANDISEDDEATILDLIDEKPPTVALAPEMQTLHELHAKQQAQRAQPSVLAESPHPHPRPLPLHQPHLPTP